MRRTWFLLLLLVGLLNCQGVQRQPDKPAGLDAGLKVQVLRGAEGQRALQPGDKLRPSETVELELSVAAPAYVYVILYSPAGESTIVYPPQTPGQSGERLQPGVPKRVTFTHPSHNLPEPEADLRLLAVASAEPIGPALCTLLRLSCGMNRVMIPTRGNEPPKPPPSEPPKPSPTSPKEPGPPPKTATKDKDRRPVPPGEESRNPACVAFMDATHAGPSSLALIVPVVLNYETSSKP